MKLKINNQEQTVDCPDDTPLLWVIREHFQLKGTKFGCGKGLCGACTVHLNGAPIRSCSFPAAGAVGQNVTTIEGIGTPTNLHPVQKAWAECNVPQCGYCQSGQIMSACALVASNKNPSEKDILDAMSGNICRCGTYPRIKKAIRAACELKNQK